MILALTVLLGLAWGVNAQEKSPALQPVENPWYIGIVGGTSFGQCTFWSITEQGVRSWGLQGGLFGGYRFNRLISLEAGFQYGNQSQFNLDCCPYWLSTAGEWKATQVIDKDGWYFKDLEVATRWYKFALQGNFNLLSFIKGNTHWSLDLSPQISLVNTRSTWMGPLSASGDYHEETQPQSWHFGAGGQIGAGYAFDEYFKVGLYGGITALTGERFDNLPTNVHHTNLIWDAGLKFTVSLGNGRKKAAAAAAAAAAAEAERLAAELAAREEAERLAAEKAAREEAERLAAEKAAREKAEAEAAAKAAAEEAAKYYHGTFPVIYFADNSIKLGAETEKLKEVARIMQEYPKTTLSLEGYASKWGTPEYNDVVTEKRLQKVKDYLVELGVDEDRIYPLTNMGIDYKAKRSADARRVEIIAADKDKATRQREEDAENARRLAAADAALASGDFFGTLYFDTESTEIDGPGNARLRELKSFLEGNPEWSVVLYGFASKPGHPEYNLSLTWKRVNSVKNRLIELGIPATRIRPVVGKGVDTEVKRYRDARRVNIFTVEK